MKSPSKLFLYEEVMLLALRDEEGTIACGNYLYGIAGAVLAELILAERIEIEHDRKQLVNVLSDAPLGDPIVDECLARMASAKRRASLTTWVPRLAGIHDLKHRVARQLCDRGILSAEQDKILFLFTRRVYPEINPTPERRIIQRLDKAIFDDAPQVDPRTVILVSIAQQAQLLPLVFNRRELRSKKKRIQQIIDGELTGKATQQAIAACQAAIVVACVIPAIVTSTVINS